MKANHPRAQIRKEGRTVLTEIESKELIAEAGLPVVATMPAGTRAEAVRLSGQIAFPVAMKIASPDIIHKSDSGGVRLNLENTDQVEEAFDEIIANARRHHPDAFIHGVSMQKMAPPGLEVIVGMSKDPQFGPLLMFGLGGVMVELFKDVSFRIVPFSPRDAHEMIAEIRAYPVLTGFRGAPGVDVVFLEGLLLQCHIWSRATRRSRRSISILWWLTRMARW
jgi:acetate---CoA ligase (ADP-forming) subunit beta